MKKLVLIPLLGLLVSVAGCFGGADTVPPPQGSTLLYGDSLIEEASPYLHGGEAVSAYGGTALCDWLDRIEQDVNTLHPQKVVLSFIGNYGLTPCSQGISTPEEIRAKYAADIADLKARVHVPLVWVLDPITRDKGEPIPNSLYAAEPLHVDAGAAVEGTNGEYLPEYRATDGVHLSSTGAEKFASAIDAGM